MAVTLTQWTLPHEWLWFGSSTHKTHWPTLPSTRERCACIHGPWSHFKSTASFDRDPDCQIFWIDLHAPKPSNFWLNGHWRRPMLRSCACKRVFWIQVKLAIRQNGSRTHWRQYVLPSGTMVVRWMERYVVCNKMKANRPMNLVRIRKVPKVQAHRIRR